MFEVEMLPAREGDCLWVRYGDAAKPKQLLIDAGRAATYKGLRSRLLALPPEQRTFELFIISHVDRDHIEGAMTLLEDAKLPIKFKQIWFNGYDHLKSATLEVFGAVQGERVTAALLKRKRQWNKAWKGKAVALRGKTLPTAKLDGGMKLTLLSPDRQKLLDLVPTWEAECKAAGIIPGSKARLVEQPGIEHFGALDVEQLALTKFVSDTTKPNGTSIVVLAEYGGKRALFGADSHVDRLGASVAQLRKARPRLAVDLFKVSHHGSERNVSRELIEQLDCPLYLISTNGSYFQHPAAVAISRIVKFGGAAITIAFNYRSKFTTVWDQAALKAKYGFTTVYPAKKDNGTLVVRLA
jgi:beta-lactamase superfamily II metal-dependent hydrolase